LKKLIFSFLLISNYLFAWGDRGLIEETFLRGDYFNTISFSKELFFYSNSATDRCFASMFISESFARYGNYGRSFRWLKRVRKFCESEKYTLFLAYLSAEANVNGSLKLIRRNSRKLYTSSEWCYTGIVVLAKNLKFRKAIKLSNFCAREGIISHKLPELLEEKVRVLKVMDRFYSQVWKLGVIPGVPQFLLGRAKEGIGEDFIIAVSMAGLIYSYSHGGFFELWLFPLINYYFGGMIHSYNLAREKEKQNYEIFSQWLNENFLYKPEVFSKIIEK